jgi:hypothetical protein
VPSAEDERLGRLLRTIRRREHMTQEALATAVRVPVRDVIRLEAGGVGYLRLDRTRRLFEAVGGRAKLTAWYDGALADRLLDERHAAISERLVAILGTRGWLPAVEHTFSEYGERGSIDVFAAHPARRVVAVFEVKSVIGSFEEMNRALDTKVRLAPKLALSRFGFRPTHVGRILVMPEDRTLRRVISRLERTMASLYPAGSREVRGWLKRPDRDLSGIWFLTELQQPQTVSS